MSEGAEIGGGFSSPKREILLLLKRGGDPSLQQLAADLGITKVATLRHVIALEADGLVERSYRSEGVGRPRVHFRLSSSSSKLFPQAYTQMSLSALGFIEERLGRDAVVELLQQRTRELGDQSVSRFRGKNLPARVDELVHLRSEGGYMAERGPTTRGTLEMKEHNCPILAIADRYPVSCEVERRMFERMLEAKVDVSHRVVAGDPVCRFLIRPKGRP